MRTEEWVQKEKVRLNKGMSKIDTELEKTKQDYDKIMISEPKDFEEERHKLHYLSGKMQKLNDEKTQNRGRIKIINKILEVKF